MLQHTHLQTVNTESESLPEPVQAGQNPRVIHEGAEKLARALTWLPNLPSSPTFVERSHAVAHALKPVFDAVEGPHAGTAGLRRVSLVVRQQPVVVFRLASGHDRAEVSNQATSRSNRPMAKLFPECWRLRKDSWKRSLTNLVSRNSSCLWKCFSKPLR